MSLATTALNIAIHVIPEAAAQPFQHQPYQPLLTSTSFAFADYDYSTILRENKRPRELFLLLWVKMILSIRLKLCIIGSGSLYHCRELSVVSWYFLFLNSLCCEAHILWTDDILLMAVVVSVPYEVCCCDYCFWSTWLIFSIWGGWCCIVAFAMRFTEMLYSGDEAL